MPKETETARIEPLLPTGGDDPREAIEYLSACASNGELDGLVVMRFAAGEAFVTSWGDVTREDLLLAAATAQARGMRGL